MKIFAFAVLLADDRDFTSGVEFDVVITLAETEKDAKEEILKATAHFHPDKEFCRLAVAVVPDEYIKAVKG